jgi:hypothetical protein
MYFAGLLDATRIEQIIWAVTIAEAARAMRLFKRAGQDSERDAGTVQTKPSTKSFAGILLPTHGALLFLPILCYLATVPFTKFVQPKWMAALSLPSCGLSTDDVHVLRLVGISGLIAAVEFTRVSLNYLGRNFHTYGVRERPTLSSKGPYSVVSFVYEQRSGSVSTLTSLYQDSSSDLYVNHFISS